MPVAQQINFLASQASCLFVIAMTYRDSKADRNFSSSLYWTVVYL
ncbi:hypothetical protein [Microcoleus sp. N3A4]